MIKYDEIKAKIAISKIYGNQVLKERKKKYQTGNTSRMYLLIIVELPRILLEYLMTD